MIRALYIAAAIMTEHPQLRARQSIMSKSQGLSSADDGSADQRLLRHGQLDSRAANNRPEQQARIHAN